LHAQAREILGVRKECSSDGYEDEREALLENSRMIYFHDFASSHLLLVTVRWLELMFASALLHTLAVPNAKYFAWKPYSELTLTVVTP